MMSNKPYDKFPDEDFIIRVREHKHNYSPSFGNVVHTPARRLFYDLINNPDKYTDKEEREKIINAFVKAVEMKAIYDQIGYKLDEQLECLHHIIIPGIQENASLFRSILSNHVSLSNALINRLNLSLNGTDELCNKLENLEFQEYGVAEDFCLRDEILNAFRQDNINIGIEGEKSSIQVFTMFGEYADVQTHMPKDVFLTHVIGNLISNLHKHAFKEDTQRSVQVLTRMKKRGFWSQIRFWIFGPSVADLYVYKTEIEEKQVQIEFTKDKTSPDRLNIIIRNNGMPFDGDTTKVFEYGTGTGEGIGLYSAKSFLKEFDADIKMESTPDKEYTVSFIINLPIISS